MLIAPAGTGQWFGELCCLRPPGKQVSNPKPADRGRQAWRGYAAARGDIICELVTVILKIIGARTTCLPELPAQANHPAISILLLPRLLLVVGVSTRCCIALGTHATLVQEKRSPNALTTGPAGNPDLSSIFPLQRRGSNAAADAHHMRCKRLSRYKRWHTTRVI